nr:hypothetical protein BaRGS_026155 [Batillaria attramentaria]
MVLWLPELTEASTLVSRVQLVIASVRSALIQVFVVVPAADGKCVVFSYSQSNGSCVLSRRPDDDATVYDTPSPVWDTYNSVCPKDKGYVQYDFHQPPLCLRYVGETLNHSDAGERCQKDGAKLVRVKTMQVYNIVKQILIGCVNKMIWVGADDRAVEGQHVWSDGTSLARFTDMWRDPTEGGKASEDCISVSSTKLLIDTSCDLLKTFMCQYDI